MTVPRRVSKIGPFKVKTYIFKNKRVYLGRFGVIRTFSTFLGSRPKSKIEKIEEITISPIANVSTPVGRDASLECAISGTLSMENLRVKYDKV